MNGWQLATQVKVKFPDVQIAVVTGWGEDISEDQKNKNGVNYLLGKPVSMQEIQNLIIMVLKNKHL